MPQDNTRFIKINEANLLYKGFFEFSELKITHSLYQGGESEVLSREVFNRNQAVVVLLYDLKHRNVVLVEQFRAGAVRNAMQSGKVDDAWLLEPVAGMIDEGEDAVQAGIRESKEETGIDVVQLEYISQFYPSPGACDEILHLYAAEIDSTLVDNHAGKSDEHEDIRVVVMSFEEAKRRMLNAEFNVASTFIALQWLFNQKLND